MKRISIIVGGALLLGHSATFAQAPQVKRCGAQQVHEYMISQDPTWKQKFEEQRASLETDARNYIAQAASGAMEKTTAVSAVPVIFHIILDSAQFLSMGGTSGIALRCDSQIAVLNRDYNRQNADSTLIPSGWKSLYGKPGIQFGLARKNPSGTCSPGYEIKIITSNGFTNINNAFPEAKTASTGLAAWDVTKYYNVWCINFTGSASSLLGITVPKSQASFYPANNEGVCILYNTLGCTAPNTGVSPGSSPVPGNPPAGTGSYSGGGWNFPYNLGRTLTHETGHFFEIWHPWGDDGGACSTWSSSATVNGITCSPGVGSDDGLSDTPPESDAVYGNPAYGVSGGTEYDCCKMNGSTLMQPIGIACLSYMDYTDDDAMHMFTTLQSATMASKVLVASGENYQLTQNPSLLICPSGIVAPAETGSTLNIFPNPSTGELNVTVNSMEEDLAHITILNMLGQEVMNINGQKKDNYSIDLSGMSKGIYFVRCNFASGSVTRKISLQ